MNLDFEKTVGFCADLLQAAGLPAGRARRTASAQVEVEGFGIGTHGLRVLASYVKQLRGGDTPPDGACRVLREFGAVAALDGSRVLGVEGVFEARDRAAALAHRHGIGLVSVLDTNWIGALGYHLAAAARENFLLLAWAQMSAYPCVVPFGGRDGRLSTNPLAFVMPNDPDPVVVDFSTAIIASGKVYQWHREGKRAPEPMFYDSEGRPSDDPQVFCDHQALLPFGGALWGFRGTGLGVWIEALTAAAGGAAAGGAGNGQNVHVIAIDAAAFGDVAGYRAEWERFRDYLLSSQPAEGMTGPQLAGTAQWESLRNARANGIAIPAALWAELAGAAAALGVPAPEPIPGDDRK